MGVTRLGGRGLVEIAPLGSKSSALCCTWEWVGTKGRPHGSGGECPRCAGPPLTRAAFHTPIPLVPMTALGEKQHQTLPHCCRADLEAQP